MRKILLLVIPLLSIVVLAGPNAAAGGWTWHVNNPPGCDCTGGILTVWATHDCNNIDPAIFAGWVLYGQQYSGGTPDTWSGQAVNDMKFVWDCAGANPNCHCPTVDSKLGSARHDDKKNRWVLEDLNEWIDDNVEWSRIPLLHNAGCTTFGDIYVVVDLPRWDNRAFVPGYAYSIVGGMSPELPGYLIGTTPIVFDPTAPGNVSPFSTTPFTGTLYSHGEVFLEGAPAGDEDEDSDVFIKKSAAPPQSPGVAEPPCCANSKK
jgi:hypothetical protein